MTRMKVLVARRKKLREQLAKAHKDAVTLAEELQLTNQECDAMAKRLSRSWPMR